MEKRFWTQEERFGYIHINLDLSEVGGGVQEEFIDWMSDRCIENQFNVVFHLKRNDKSQTIVIRDSFDWGMLKEGWELKNLVR